MSAHALTPVIWTDILWEWARERLSRFDWLTTRYTFWAFVALGPWPWSHKLVSPEREMRDGREAFPHFLFSFSLCAPQHHFFLFTVDVGVEAQRKEKRVREWLGASRCASLPHPRSAYLASTSFSFLMIHLPWPDTYKRKRIKIIGHGWWIKKKKKEVKRYAGQQYSWTIISSYLLLFIFIWFRNLYAGPAYALTRFQFLYSPRPP